MDDWSRHHGTRAGGPQSPDRRPSPPVGSVRALRRALPAALPAPLLAALPAELLTALPAALLVAVFLPSVLDAAPAPGTGRTTDTLRVVAYNIKHGRGMDDRVDLQRVAGVLQRLDADVITLQEVDDRTERTGGVDQVAVLADALGYRGFHGPHRPFQGGHYGNAVLTRLSVVEARTRPIPPASGSALAVLELEIRLPSGGRASVVSVHLAGTADERLAQADAVTGFFRSAHHPVVLTGDFNGRPDGPVVSRLRRDWRLVEKSGEPATYPADAPDREIDFVMVRGAGSVGVLEHRVVPEPMAADHRPLLAVLILSSGDLRP